MDNVAWAIMIVWLFLIAIGHAWKENYFTIGGGIVGLVLMIEILTDSFVFAVALLVINGWLIWTALTSEI